MNINSESAGDLRRAGAFIKHHTYSNGDGINVILQEALDVGRPNQLIQAILGTLDAIVPQLVTTAGQCAMVEMVQILAEDTELNPDWNRAARFLLAYGDGDTEAMNRIIWETENVSPTIVAILDIYATILPTLHTPLGMTIIENGILALSAKEAEGDR